MTDAVIAEGLTYEYETGRALDEASMRAPQGEITALVGPNGAGKTTLMRLLSALMPPQRGRAEVLGVDVTKDPRAIHRRLGYVPDFIGLWDGMSVAHHLEHAGRCVGLTGAAARMRGEDIAGRLNLTNKLSAKADALSRGQRQRVAIAQALMKEPQILILDEPASGLDPEARKGLSKLMLDLKAGGATLLVSSHILSELDDYCDHVVVIRDGRIAQTSSLKAAQDAPQKIEIAFAAPVELAAIGGALSSANRAAKLLAPNRVEIEATGDAEEHAKILAALVGAGLPVAAFTPRRRSLEDAYFEAENAISQEARA